MTRRKPMTLAARVAAEVMRWEVSPLGHDRTIFRDKDGLYRRGWDPVANTVDLMDVIGELRSRGLETRIEIDPDQVCVRVAEIVNGEILGFCNLTPRGANTWQLCFARAVCRAALEAVREAGGEDG